MTENISENLKNDLISKFESRSTKVKKIENVIEKTDPGLKNIYEEIDSEISRLNSELVFTLGVIGQMKAGKSSLLNSLYFEGKEILPAAPTPLTAVLTLLKYSQEEKCIVQFYSQDEIDLIKKDHKFFNNNEGDDTIKGHYELYQKIKENNLDIQSLVGKSKTVSKNELSNYVGANGKYSPMVRDVEMYINDNSIKDVIIVDTPGLNDSITSRELKTKTFMKKADAVLFISPASQFMDAYDLNSIKQLKDLGIQNVVYVLSRFDEAVVKEVNSDDFKGLEDLKNKLEAEGEIKLKEKISTFYAISLMLNINNKLEREESLNDDDNFYLNKYTENICNKEYFKEYSGIPLIQLELKKMFDTKIVTMENKLITHIDNIDKRINGKIKDLISKYEIEIGLLNLTDSEFKKELENINNVKKEVNSIIDIVKDKFSLKFINIIEELSKGIKNIFNNTKEDININGRFNRSGISAVLNNFEIKTKSIFSEFENTCDDKFNYYETIKITKDIYTNANNSFDMISDYIQKDIISNLAEKITEGFKNFTDTLNERIRKKFTLVELREILKNCIFWVDDNEIHELRIILQSNSDELKSIISKHEITKFVNELFKDDKIKNIMFNKIDESKTELEISKKNEKENIEIIKNKIISLNNLTEE